MQVATDCILWMQAILAQMSEVHSYYGSLACC